MKIFPFLLLVPFLVGFEYPRVHFSRDSYGLSEAENQKVEANAGWLAAHKEAVLILEGHCDEWGEELYNEELGDRRAREVKARLIETGVDPERIIMVVSFGEREPIDPRPLSAAWDKNRRVEFVLR